MANNKIEYVISITTNYVVGVPTINPKYAYVTKAQRSNDVYMIEGEEVVDNQNFTVDWNAGEDAVVLNIEDAYDVVKYLVSNGYEAQIVVKLPWDKYHN